LVKWYGEAAGYSHQTVFAGYWVGQCYRATREAFDMSERSAPAKPAGVRAQCYRVSHSDDTKIWNPRPAAKVRAALHA
jgi:hypothetical protein